MAQRRAGPFRISLMPFRRISNQKISVLSPLLHRTVSRISGFELHPSSPVWSQPSRRDLVSSTTSGIQINSDTKELRPKKSHSTCVPGTAWQLIRQPALAFTRIIVREEMRSARVPSGAGSLPQFEPYVRIMLDVADIPRFHPMLCHNPESGSICPSPTGVRRGFPLFRPVVSSNAYPGCGRPAASASLIGGFSKYFWRVWTMRCFTSRLIALILDSFSQRTYVMDSSNARNGRSHRNAPST